MLLEYWGVSVLINCARVLPLSAVHSIGRFFGNLLYRLVPRRRTIAMENLHKAFHGKKTEQEIRGIARECCQSFFITYLEIIKLRFLFTQPDIMKNLRTTTEDLDDLFQKAKQLHDESGGCIFVTPHIGNWEVLPHVSAVVGIPLAVVVRPLDNIYLEKLLYHDRASSGQVIIPKRNALFNLQKTLQQGTSIGMLPDQSTMKGISVNFFGRKATTTPVPAILAIQYKRPIVIVACCRRAKDYLYEGFVSDPIWPKQYSSEKTEIFRLTEEMNRGMESIIRKYPGQYLWIHNRWKTYRNKKELLA
jgi:KDO2-lipid IV(A) lauroyltransferase